MIHRNQEEKHLCSLQGHAPDKENAPPSDIFPETENKDVEDIDSYDSDDLTIEIIDQILNSTGTSQEDETQENTFTPIEQEKIVSLAANDVSDTTAAGINAHEENISVVGGTLAPPSYYIGIGTEAYENTFIC